MTEINTLIGAGSIFAGIGVMAVTGAMAWWLYQIGRSLRYEADVDERLSIVEQKAIDEFAAKRGIDVDKEVQKREVFKEKSFKKQLKQQIVEEYFNEDSNGNGGSDN